MRLCAWLRPRKRLRFPYGIPRAEYCIRCGIPHQAGRCGR